MNNGIIRNSDNIIIEDFLLLNWSVSFNSKIYLEVLLSFNTDITTVFSDYNFINSTSGNGGLKVSMRDANNTSDTELIFTQLNSPFTTGASWNIPPTNYSVIPTNNNIKYKYESTILNLATTYTLIIRLHNGITLLERDITLNIPSSNIITSETKQTFNIKDVTFPTNYTNNSNTLNVLSGTSGISSKAYYFKSNDSTKLTINNNVNGLSSSTSGPILINNFANLDQVLVSPTYYGSLYQNDASFKYVLPTLGTLTNQSTFNVDPSKPIQLNLIKTNQTFNMGYSGLLCKLNKAIDSVTLAEINSTSGSYTMYIPIMNDIGADTMNVTFKDGNGISNKLSSHGTNFNAVVTTSPINIINGQFSFNVTYSNVPVANNSSAWGSIFISNSTGDLLLSKSLTYTVIPDVAPSISITSPTNNQVFLSTTNTINLTVSTSDSDGTVGLVKYYANNTLIGQNSTSTFGFTWTNTNPNLPVSGTNFTIKAVAYDNFNLASTSSTINIRVNELPSIAWNPTPPLTGTSGQVINLITTASDDNGITQVEFLYNATSIAVISSPTYQTPWTAPIVGSPTMYTLSAVVTDSNGETNQVTSNITISP